MKIVIALVLVLCVLASCILVLQSCESNEPSDNDVTNITEPKPVTAVSSNHLVSLFQNAGYDLTLVDDEQTDSSNGITHIQQWHTPVDQQNPDDNRLDLFYITFEDTNTAENYYETEVKSFASIKESYTGLGYKKTVLVEQEESNETAGVIIQVENVIISLVITTEDMSYAQHLSEIEEILYDLGYRSENTGSGNEGNNNENNSINTQPPETTNPGNQEDDTIVSVKAVKLDELLTSFNRAGYDMEFNDEYEGYGPGMLRDGVDYVDLWYSVLNGDTPPQEEVEDSYDLHNYHGGFSVQYITCEDEQAAKSIYAEFVGYASGEIQAEVPGESSVCIYNITGQGYEKAAYRDSYNIDGEQVTSTGILLCVEDVLIQIHIHSLLEYSDMHFSRIDGVLTSLGYE